MSDEVMTRLDCSMGKAYKIIKMLNDELKRKGYITVAAPTLSKSVCWKGSEKNAASNLL